MTISNITPETQDQQRLDTAAARATNWTHFDDDKNYPDWVRRHIKAARVEILGDDDLADMAGMVSARRCGEFGEWALFVPMQTVSGNKIMRCVGNAGFIFERAVSVSGVDEALGSAYRRVAP